MDSNNLKLLRNTSGLHLDCFFKESTEFILHGQKNSFNFIKKRISNHKKNKEISRVLMGDKTLILLPIEQKYSRTQPVGTFFEFPSADEQNIPFMQLCFYGNLDAFKNLIKFFDQCLMEEFDEESYELSPYSTRWLFPSSISLKVYVYTSIDSFRSRINKHDDLKFPESLKYMINKLPNMKITDEQLTEYFFDSIAYQHMDWWKPETAETDKGG